jgi:hypothetical protein
MSVDSILRALGAFTFIYAIGLFVALMSTAALEAASRDGSVVCADRGCQHIALTEQHHATPAGSATGSIIHVAAMFFAKNL